MHLFSQKRKKLSPKRYDIYLRNFRYLRKVKQKVEKRVKKNVVMNIINDDQ